MSDLVRVKIYSSLWGFTVLSAFPESKLINASWFTFWCHPKLCNIRLSRLNCCVSICQNDLSFQKFQKQASKLKGRLLLLCFVQGGNPCSAVWVQGTVAGKMWLRGSNSILSYSPQAIAITMTLQWTVVAFFLYAEIAVNLILCIPFISAKRYWKFNTHASNIIMSCFSELW